MSCSKNLLLQFNCLKFWSSCFRCQNYHVHHFKLLYESYSLGLILFLELSSVSSIPLSFAFLIRIIKYMFHAHLLWINIIQFLCQKLHEYVNAQYLEKLFMYVMVRELQTIYGPCAIKSGFKYNFLKVSSYYKKLI